MDLIDLTFPELAGLTTCDASSRTGSSSSDFSHYPNDLTDFSWEQLFSTLPAETFPSIYSQPSQLPIAPSTHIQPPAVPFDLSDFHMPQFDTELFSDANFNFQYPPVPLQCLNFPQLQIPELDDFMQNNGSGYFENCGYQHMTTYPTAQPPLVSGY